jgi:predicted nuclease of predicted toxin-antitoxin system
VRARLFLDEDIHFGLAATLRKRGYDVVHAQESGRKGRSDREQLEYAVDDGRCLVSFNVKDFVLLRLINEHTPDTLKNRLIFL